MTSVFIGLGSNLADPIKQIQTAIMSLSQLPKTQLLKTSSFYRSKPLGPKNQPDFINAVAELKTKLTPERLLKKLQAIETQQERRRAETWGPRTIDLDILLYGDRVICSDQLRIPHLGIKTREFVLYPLLEIAPQLRLPSGEFIADLAKNCKNLLFVISRAETQMTSTDL